MSKRTSGFVERSAWPPTHRRPLDFLKDVSTTDGRVIQISAGNPND